jgi:hypothetical protein
MNTNILELVQTYRPSYARGAAGLTSAELQELTKFGIAKNSWTRLVNNTASIETIMTNAPKVAAFLGCDKDEIKFL